MVPILGSTTLNAEPIPSGLPLTLLRPPTAYKIPFTTLTARRLRLVGIGGLPPLITSRLATPIDVTNNIGSRLPWMTLFVGVASFVVLFLAFGSVVLPLKSIVLTLLSLSASFREFVPLRVLAPERRSCTQDGEPYHLAKRPQSRRS